MAWPEGNQNNEPKPGNEAGNPTPDETPRKPDQRSTGDWTDANYTQALTSIRHGEWNDAAAAIVSLRDHIRGLGEYTKELEERNEKLRKENARLISEMTYEQPKIEETGTTIEVEENKVEDIDSLWK